MKHSSLFILLVCALTACQSAKLKQTAETFDSPLADIGPTDRASLEHDLAEAKNNNIHLISPTWYSAAQNAFEKSDYTASRVNLNKAFASAQPLKDRMMPLIEARAAALDAGAASLNKFKGTEADFIKLTTDFDTAYRDRSISRIASLTEDYYLQQDHSHQPMIEQLSDQALVASKRALALTRQAKAWEDLNLEETVLKTEALLGVAGAAIPADLRDRSFEAQASELARHYQQYAGERATFAQQNEQLSEQNQKIAELEGKEKTLQELQEAKEQSDRFEKVRKSFDEKEAKVYRQGNSLVIHLKQIQFPTGASEVPLRAFPTLEKVGKAIEELHGSAVIVEGHTDATGSEELNKSLSQARADAVKQYLESAANLSNERIESIGKGSEQPLVSNKTKEGRATNRRIDVIITR